MVGMEGYLYKELRKKYGVNELRRGQIRIIRYADDFVIMHKDKKVIEDSKRITEEWLKTRGLKLSEEKTQIVHSTEGFDFDGFNIRHYPIKISGWYGRNNTSKQDSKLLIKPSKKSVKAHNESLHEVLDTMRAATQEEIIRKLNPIIKGWSNYFRGIVCAESFGKMDNLLWKKLWQWSSRRHANKGRKWITERYFHTIKGRKWYFADTKEGKIHKVLALHTETKTQRHVKIKSGKSFYDGDEIYWASRLSKGYGDITPSKAKLLKKQKGICQHCYANFRNDDLMESHHIRHKAKGGKDSYKNLVLVHRHCHDQLHAIEHDKRKKNKNLAAPYRKMGNAQAEILGIV